VKKTFYVGQAQVHALRGIDLQVNENELLMLMGPSGSGKTTLISIIGGILNQDEGACEVLHQDINHLPLSQKAFFRGKNVGFVFQTLNLIPTLNAVENVCIPLLVQKVDKNEACLRAKEILTKVGLKDRFGSYPKELSGGEQQRVSIARGCIHRPKVILCDEPTSFLDMQTGRTVIEMLREIQKMNQCSIVIVTHDPRILDYADRIEEISDGVIQKKQ
jgi:putative ABC transport system ATP-binding protein